MKKSVRSCEKHIHRYISYEKIRLFNNDQLIANGIVQTTIPKRNEIKKQ